jgi:hypothetical protein
MHDTGFGTEWLTIGQHRVLLRCRGTFPDDHMRFVARVAAEFCDHNSQDTRARVVSVFHDDVNCDYRVLIASTKPADARLEDLLMKVLHTLFGFGNYTPEVKIVSKGNEQSDHYVHAAHLSRQAGVMK